MFHVAMKHSVCSHAPGRQGTRAHLGQLIFALSLLCRIVGKASDRTPQNDLNRVLEP